METNSERRSAIKEWLAAQPAPKPAPPGVAWDDLNDAEKAAVQAVIDSNRRKQDEANRRGNGGINISIPLPNINIGLKIPCPRPGGGAVLPNPAPVPPSVPTPDLPGTNNSSTNGGTNRSPFATNPTNVTIRTNPSNVNTNPGSTNRGTNGNGRGVTPRPGFTN